MTHAPAAPVAECRPHHSEHHGVGRDDPYHWLRDPGYPTVNDPAIIAYLEAENDYFRAVMAPLQPMVEELTAELKGRIAEDDASVPVVDGDYRYHWRFAAGAQYRQWYRQPVAGGAAELILDEQALAAGRDFFKLGGFAVSPDGRRLAYSFDEDGGERFILKIRDLVTGQDLPEAIPDTIDSPVWAADSGQLLYAVLNDAWRPYQIRLHRLGRDLSDGRADPVLYEESDPGFRVHPQLSQSRALIFLVTGDHVTSEIRFVPAADPQAPPVVIAERLAGRQYDADHDGQRLYLRVNDRHRNFRIVSAPTATPGPEHWQEVVAGSDQRYLRAITAFRDCLVIEERRAGLDQIVLHRVGQDQEGQGETLVAFPDAVYEASLGSNPAPVLGRLRLHYSSMARPATVYDYDPATATLITLKVQEIPSGHDPDDYVTERVMAPARDGVLIPVSLVYRRGWQRGSGAPLHLYGYGAYGYGMPPAFNANRLSLLNRGFAYAIAHIRGGDELGYGWYEEGKGFKRTNSFHDFIDAARFLISEGYARTGGISISGGSAGGQLMGAVLNEAPELWAAVVAHVPFVDCLATMLDPTLPLTPPEWPEWGNPITDPAAFAYIRSYSPYDNVQAQPYPPLLVTAGLNDPRVTYWEPAKWVARLRQLKTDQQPLLLKTNMAAGHGGKSGRFDRLVEVAEEYAFILHGFARNADQIAVAKNNHSQNDGTL